MAVVVLLTPVWWSFAGAMTNPAMGVSLAGRAAEWFRDHGGASIVVWAENTWYGHHPPPVGGQPARGIVPAHHKVTPSAPVSVSIPHLPEPAALQPFGAATFAGEGQWQPAGRTVAGIPAVYETYLTPDAVHTSVVAGIAWMDPKLLRATLYSGSTIPGGGPWRYTAPIGPNAATSLVAAFNAGFLMSDSNGGYYTQGQTVIPLRQGGASFVIYKNGDATIGAWGSDVSMTPNVVSVRQNLALLVSHGQPVAGLNANDTTKWGLTLGNQIYVWRSGVGVTANGALVYVAGPYLNITDLANLLVRAGAVRGMELDINIDWVNFATYAPSTPGGPANSTNGADLLSNMSAPPSRYFQSWWTRDFFTMSARSNPGG